MIYEVYDTLDNRVVRVFHSRVALQQWLSRTGYQWLSRGYSYRLRRI